MKLPDWRNSERALMVFFWVLLAVALFVLAAMSASL